jgi:hypothetical protein
MCGDFSLGQTTALWDHLNIYTLLFWQRPASLMVPGACLKGWADIGSDQVNTPYGPDAALSFVCHNARATQSLLGVRNENATHSWRGPFLLWRLRILESEMLSVLPQGEIHGFPRLRRGVSEIVLTHRKPSTGIAIP